MGELADDIINGQSCSWCGVCFVKEHGYPVACKDCWEDHDDQHDKTETAAQKAIFDEL